MKKWSFVTGLTFILLLLLTLSGYTVSVIRWLTSDLNDLIAKNYDTVRAVRELRSCVTRLNVHYLGVNSPEALRAGRTVFDTERAIIDEHLKFLARNVNSEQETPLVERLGAYTKDFISAYESYLSISGRSGRSVVEKFDDLSNNIAQLTGDIQESGTALIDLNEKQIFQRRDAAVARGKRATAVSLTIVAFSLLVYIFASIQLARGIYQPLRKLRDAITRVRQRSFEQPILVEGSDELAQIAYSFNQMAVELRKYIEETDDKAVQASRDRRAILAALPHPVFIVNEDLSLRLSNPRGESLMKAAGSEGMVPTAIRRLIDNAAAQYEELVDNDMKRVVEYKNEDSGGPSETTAYLPQIFRLTDPHGAPEGWAVLLIDVTQLRRLDQAKSKAISTIGHEIKTPITGIRMTLHLLLEEKIGHLNAEQKELIQAGRDDCERLLAVLQSLLELARLESGRTAVRIETTAAKTLLLQAEAMYGAVVKNAGATLELLMPAEPMPDVQADLMHAGRVLGNFLSNAAKYGAPGEKVTLQASPRADGYVRFSVLNTAARPFSEAEQSRLFEPFYRRAGEQAEGAGLGLAIAKEIAAAHGGRIGVWGEGKLVEFYLDLRLAKSQAKISVSQSKDVTQLSAPSYA